MFNLEKLYVATGAFRHGLLYDMLDREHAETDIRSLSILNLVRNFHADQTQAERVKKVAHFLFQQLEKNSSCQVSAEQKNQTDWAIDLHEVGSLISHSDYHKHSAYIIDNTDILGFTQSELHQLSLLVLGHKGKLRKLEIDFDHAQLVLPLMVIRLAVILCHARHELDYKQLKLKLSNRQFELLATEAWLNKYPQSAHLLKVEMKAWQHGAWRFILI
jgi:exopolyphosphatase/guanosine-5'-triphosphate,3'-diphosphate pyrophosphatase